MTTYVVYSLDGAMNDFAIFHAGGVSTPLQLQGVCSYTATAGPNESRLFQFREKGSTIDMGNSGLAKAVHPEFVASCKYLGTIGDSRPLHIYEMDNLPGIAHVMARISLGGMHRQCNTIKDLTKYA